MTSLSFAHPEAPSLKKKAKFELRTSGWQSTSNEVGKKTCAGKLQRFFIAKDGTL